MPSPNGRTHDDRRSRTRRALGSDDTITSGSSVGEADTTPTDNSDNASHEVAIGGSEGSASPANNIITDSNDEENEIGTGNSHVQSPPAAENTTGQTHDVAQTGSWTENSGLDNNRHISEQVENGLLSQMGSVDEDPSEESVDSHPSRNRRNRSNNDSTANGANGHSTQNA